MNIPSTHDLLWYALIVLVFFCIGYLYAEAVKKGQAERDDPRTEFL